MTSANPLIEFQLNPRFDEIKAEHIQPACEWLIKQTEQMLQNIENSANNPSFKNIVLPLDSIARLFERIWEPIDHLNAVRNEIAFRTEYEKMIPHIVNVSLRLKQSGKIFEGLNKIKNSGEWQTLTSAEQRIIDLYLKSAKNAGVGLSGDARDKFNALFAKLSELQTKFTNNFIDATKAFELVLTTKDEIQGLPENYLALSSKAYNDAHPENKGTKEHGPWLISLAAHSSITFLEMSERRDLREKLWRAYVGRANDKELDNNPLMKEILELRKELAILIGYKTWAEVSLSEKMAETVSAVRDLTGKIRPAARAKAKSELDNIQILAKTLGSKDNIEPWDLGYFRNKYTEQELSFNNEFLRQYFPLPKVLSGLFKLIKDLFQVTIEKTDEKVSLWDKDVEYFTLKDKSNNTIAHIYMDLYARPANKRSGAWVNSCVNRRKYDSSLELPIGYICCNFPPPGNEAPSLLSFEEVTTLFHEMGHALQVTLTTVDQGAVSGISGIEWDTVELASQFMENWCYQEATLKDISGHYQTQAPIPEEIVAKIQKKKTFLNGLGITRQMTFLETDMYLHHEYNPSGGTTPHQVYEKMTKENYVLDAHPADRFLCGFMHIFGGGYAAGYFSYMWAEVLSADAFAAFEEVGLQNKEKLKEVGLKYRNTILALGGSRHPQQVFQEFRGRKPTPEAFLRHKGIAN